ncbi:CsbD family protein [Arthrobacter frigidicola]|nr:CsbD family protein [Arthrobacter frigidicola]
MKSIAGLDDKIDNASQTLGGPSKEAAGHATGDESLKALGPRRPGQQLTSSRGAKRSRHLQGVRLCPAPKLAAG